MQITLTIVADSREEIVETLLGLASESRAAGVIETADPGQADLSPELGPDVPLSPAPGPDAAPEPEPNAGHDADALAKECINKMAALYAAGHRDEIRKLVESYGVDNFKKIDPEHHPEVFAALRALEDRVAA